MLKILCTAVALTGMLAAFGLESAQAASVYVMSSGNATADAAVGSALTGAGHTVTAGLPWHQQNGGQGLASHDAVVLLNNYNWSSSPMPAAGQAEILDYVQNGGGLVTSEWFVWNLGSSDRFPGLAPLSPVQPTGSYNSAASTTYTQVTANPILNEGLPAAMTFALGNISGTETVFNPWPGATVFYSSSNGGGVPGSGGVVGWDAGSGRVISFSTLIGLTELSQPDYAHLFVNAVEWSAAVPLPGALWLLGSGLAGLAVWRRRAA
ncbi:MAG: VPLPA-CTERM sorting domain-containing protein [Thermodesulfobacteriota bacterium]